MLPSSYSYNITGLSLPYHAQIVRFMDEITTPASHETKPLSLYVYLLVVTSIEIWLVYITQTIQSSVDQLRQQ